MQTRCLFQGVYPPEQSHIPYNCRALLIRWFSKLPFRWDILTYPGTLEGNRFFSLDFDEWDHQSWQFKNLKISNEFILNTSPRFVTLIKIRGNRWRRHDARGWYTKKTDLFLFWCWHSMMVAETNSSWDSPFRGVATSICCFKVEKFLQNHKPISACDRVGSKFSMFFRRDEFILKIKGVDGTYEKQT